MPSKIDLSDPYFNDYQDRGIKKWNGFYLSEHTSIIDKEKTAAKKNIPQKRRMTEGEIGQLLEFAFNNNRQVTIQLEIVDSEGNYNDDTIGFVEGFDELGLMIGLQKVHYDEIRNVELFHLKKWSDMT
ncbi:hypothetical protein [Candidatus Enterococcus mansonii]|uniref:YolD-like protein n=1 Tax=Candidatus Enterococcus mansonii TaxID=1834181 RepID=A0A242CK81_9ENTE|nr:hypothetical protein [Enterococcus sp. 4G2_DIV0659]OTO10657.1 hypothetical protein A5880_001341 [Enterococcus sp. 4G2_DIV0659]